MSIGSCDFPSMRTSLTGSRDTRSHDALPKYRILLVVRHPVGGIRTFCRYVYQTFDPDRYCFTLICPDLPEARVLLQDLAHLDLAYVPMDKHATNLELFRKVTSIVWDGQFDLVHSHGFTSGICSVPGALSRRVPHIVTCHDVLTDGQFVGPIGWLKRLTVALALATASCVHCVTQDARDNLLSRLKLLKALKTRPTVITNGIEAARFSGARARDLRKELDLPADSFLIGFFGRMMSQKGFAYLVDALERLKARGCLAKQPVVLAFGEDDGFIREEKANVERKGLSDSFFFLPFASDIAPALKGVDVVAMPSLWEACGLLAMEAMVAGVPLIGTDCVGLREVLRDTPAALVPPRDSAALSEALGLEMAKPTGVRAARFAPVAAARFDVGARAAELEREMIRCLEKRSARKPI